MEFIMILNSKTYDTYIIRFPSLDEMILHWWDMGSPNDAIFTKRIIFGAEDVAKILDNNDKANNRI